MVVNSDEEINKKILDLRKDNWGLFRIHKWLTEWDNFKMLDEQVTLAHILNVLNDGKMNVTKREISYTFSKYYKRDFHGDKKSYLKWLYGLVDRKKIAHRVVSQGKTPLPAINFDNSTIGGGNLQLIEGSKGMEGGNERTI